VRKSEDRILMTHVGSLPRGVALNDLLIRSELGEGVDRGELDFAIEGRVAHVFRQQLDGERGRVGFQTYVADRMSGFGGESNRRRPLAIGRRHLAGQGWSPGAHLR
jgi:5-methyltetrahydropteroyltriglutamate--homocysteine methyltransferase